MANSYSAPLPATEVGSFFVSQYYPVLQQQPEATHQFYTDASSVVRVDGESSEAGSGLGQIHTLIMSRIFTNVHIKTINSLESWNGGVHLVVSGFVKSNDFTGRKNFVQSFFLAPQEKGYFVLNDIFNLIGDEVIDQSPEMAHSDDIINSQTKISEPVGQETASDYPLEEEAREYVESVHIEAANPVEEYTFQEHQHEPEADYEAEQEETQVEELADFHPIVAEAAHEPRFVAIEEPASEPQKFSYASILRAAKGKPAPPVAVQRPTKSKMPVSDSHVHQSSPADPVIQNSTSDIGEEGLSHESGETKSVYVKNLPLTASTLDIVQEFQNFGKIKKDGVFLRQKKEIGICFAFVEFEDAQSVGNAVKASPIQLAGRQVYIEERRPAPPGASRGGGRGGRGSRGGRFGGRGYGRNSDQYNGESNRFGSNGFRNE